MTLGSLIFSYKNKMQYNIIRTASNEAFRESKEESFLPVRVGMEMA
jgi:hypothetical protein